MTHHTNLIAKINRRANCEIINDGYPGTADRSLQEQESNEPSRIAVLPEVDEIVFSQMWTRNS